MPLVHLVRHGQASFGAADYDVLSDLGRFQAERTRRALVDRARDPVLVSGTLRRQRDTATVLAGNEAVTPAIDARWDEYDHLALVRRHAGTAQPSSTTLSPREFQAQLDRALLQWIEADDPDGWRAFSEGAAAALRELATSLPTGRDAVVVTSGGVIAALAGRLVSAAPAGIVALNRMLVNASVTTVLAGSTGLNLLTYNESGHLGELRSYR